MALYRSQNTEQLAKMRYLHLNSPETSRSDLAKEYLAAAYRFFDLEEVEKLLSSGWLIFEFKENGKQFKFPLTGTFQGPDGEEKLRDALKKI